MVAPLARLIYNFGEPGCGAHQRMKVARWLMGRFPSPHFRRPVRPLSDAAIAAIRAELGALQLLPEEAPAVSLNPTEETTHAYA
jgi:dihydrodipicolinate synthase/N-acetylneuraminate lyase